MTTIIFPACSSEHLRNNEWSWQSNDRAVSIWIGLNYLYLFFPCINFDNALNYAYTFTPHLLLYLLFSSFKVWEWIKSSKHSTEFLQWQLFFYKCQWLLIVVIIFSSRPFPSKLCFLNSYIISLFKAAMTIQYRSNYSNQQQNNMKIPLTTQIYHLMHPLGLPLKYYKITKKIFLRSYSVVLFLFPLPSESQVIVRKWWTFSHF